MRMRFFALARPVPTPTTTPGEEESIQKESKASSHDKQDAATASMSEDSSQNDTELVNDNTPLPEFDLEQADDLKRLLLGPLEPNMY